MINMAYLKILTSIFLSFISLEASSALISDSIIGSWQVSEVHINTSSGRTAEYQWNDPRLRLRFFEISKTHIKNDIYSEDAFCKNPMENNLDSKLEDVLVHSLAGYENNGSDFINDYKLNSYPKPIKNISIICDDGLWNKDLGVGKKINGSWISLLSNKRLLLRWRDETVLVLDRFDSRKSTPTFMCFQAKTKTEKIICSSPSLSAYDRSIGIAYKDKYNTLDNIKTKQRFVMSQKKWIQDRDKCKIDFNCIMNAMGERIEQLMIFN